MTAPADAARPHQRLLRWGLPAVPVAAAVVVVGVSVDRGGDEPDAPPAMTSRSSSIAWDEAGEHLWVTSPDDDQVVEVDPDTLEVVRRIDVPGQPRELTALGPDLLVTGAQSTDLALVTPDAPPDDAVSLLPLPCGGSRGVVTLPAAADLRPLELAVVTCPTDGRLVVVDIGRILVLGTIELSGRPTGIVRDGSTLTVSTALDGRLLAIAVADVQDAVDRIDPADRLADVPALTVPVSARRVWADGKRTASSLAALDAGPRGPVGAYQVVDNQRRLSREEIEAGSTYGSPKDGRARLEPALAGACGARFSSLTDEDRRLSGPVAVAAAPEGDLVWVVGEFSHSVSVVRCDGAGASARSATVASFAVGEGARGIVLDDDGRGAFVDVGFDHEVAELRLPDGVEDVDADDPIERQDPTVVGRRAVEDRYLSPLAQQGRRMFNDATDTHLTPFGVVTCGSCHPSAGDDGLQWRIERSDPETREIERKVRRTPAAWQVDPATKPLHWDGAFTSSDTLALDTVQQLLGGDGLLVDTAALSAYMAEVAAPPAEPGLDRRRVEQGEAVFEARCASCHSGAAGTDGEPHDVLRPSTVADGGLAAAVTPPLRTVRGRGPYGHDGRARTLEALLGEHGDGEGGTISLTPEERAAVLTYLDGR